MMIRFCESLHQLPATKKRHAKTKHQNKHMVILILSELYWPPGFSNIPTALSLDVGLLA